ncbi:MAG: hypothetical protein ACFCGT_15090 [Sandaracinaceae bacterium]
MMTQRCGPTLVLTIFATIAGWTAPQLPAAHALGPDVCDFTRAATFSYDDVLACYRSVPWCDDPSDPVRCDRDNQVQVFRETVDQFSTVRGNYDDLNGWRARLDAIEAATFASDYDQFLAFQDLLREFRNFHWVYIGPSCYTDVVFPFIPLDFGSTWARTRWWRAPEQVIYLEEPFVEFADFYRDATGIDLSALEGLRVVKINGVPVLDYFRDWGERVRREDASAGINLMGALEFGTWSVRFGPLGELPEERAVDFLLETRGGRRVHKTLPWVFTTYGAVGFGGGPVPSSTQEFQDFCFDAWPPPPMAPPPPPGGLVDLVRTASDPRELHEAARGISGPIAASFELMAQRNAVDRAEGGPPGGRGPRLRRFLGYTEVPPSERNKYITEILPLTDGARVVQFGQDTTVLQLNFDFVEPWFEEVQLAGEYACANSERLIVDLRNNFGGFVGQGEWFAQYLNPGAPFADTRFIYRDLAIEPAVNELRGVAELGRSIIGDLFFPPGAPVPPCLITPYEASCQQSPVTGELLSDPLWYTQNNVTELRGRDLETMTDTVALTDLLLFNPPPEAIPCAGKFAEEDLIVLVNGQNASMGFFAAQWLGEIGEVVVAGGYLGEAMTAGQARGGSVVDTTYFTSVQDVYVGLANDFVPELAGITREGLFQFALPDLNRNVLMTLEELGPYFPDGTTLTVDDPPPGDVQVAFWSNSLETDGAAYRTVVSAVETDAIIEPACGSPAGYWFCRGYERCADRALARAVHRGDITTESANRVSADAARACRTRRF